MPSEILRVLVEAEFIVQRAHAVVEGIKTVPRLRIVLLHVLHPHEEAAEAPLLEQPHQVAGEGLLLVDRHFGDLSRLVHVRTLHRFEFQITRHARVNEKLDEEAVRHQELGNEIDVPIPAAAIALVRRRGLELAE